MINQAFAENDDDQYQHARVVHALDQEESDSDDIEHQQEKFNEPRLASS